MNISANLYDEVDSLKEKIITSFIVDIPKVDRVITDSNLAELHHLYYLREIAKGKELPKISKVYFLYIWFCIKDINKDLKLKNMSYYKYFDTPNFYIVSKGSYWDFTQRFIAPKSSGKKLNIHKDSTFTADIFPNFPVSQHYVLDNIELDSDNSYATLEENNRVILKSIPCLMEPPDANILKSKYHEKDCLLVYNSKCTVRYDMRMCSIISKDIVTHKDIVTKLCRIMETDQVSHFTTRQTFYFPSREINYNQIVHWLNSKSIQTFPVGELQHIIVENLFDNSKCEICNKVLEANKCYYNEQYEIYRLRGEKVLEITISGNVQETIIQQRLDSIFSELDESITEDHKDPMDLDATNIAKLRATNSIIFDSLYCRKAPPDFQPLVIKKCQIEEHVKKGKMILMYKNMYYTTKDKEDSRGQDFIGMINKFGDYDPRKLYVPIIRTYKKNHLLSKNFKELKAYLLRNSRDPNVSYIDKADLILPLHMSHLYNIPLYNKDPEISTIHSKKTSASKSNKVLTAEVPDTIKTLLGTSFIERLLVQGKGSKLLECCKVDSRSFLLYVKINFSKYEDLRNVEYSYMVSCFDSGNLDHRLYGKLIEDYTGFSLIVFDIDGVIPYRCSKCSKEKSILLFRCSDSTYEKIVITEQVDISTNIRTLKNILKDAKCILYEEIKSYKSRPIDYTWTLICLLGYAMRKAKEFLLNVDCVLIRECHCEQIVEDIYRKCIYFEGWVKNTNSKYHENFVISGIKHSCINVTKELLFYVMYPLIYKITADEIIFLSPINILDYNPVNLTLEDCLYGSSNSFKLRKNEEIQCLLIP